MQQYLARIIGPALAKRVGAYLISGAWRSLLLQLSSTLLVLLSSIVVARLSGAEGFGIYTLVFTWVTILSIGATVGLDDLLLKEIPRQAAAMQHGSIRLLLHWSNRLGLGVAVATAAAFAIFVYLSPIFVPYQHFLYLGLLCIPLFTLMHINQAGLRAFQRMGKGQLAEKFIQPLGFLLFVAASYFLGIAVDDAQLIGYRVLSFAPAALLAFYWLHRHTHKIRTAPLPPQPMTLQRQWLGAARYFGYMSLLIVINNRADLVFLGWLSEPEQIAYFNVATKFSDLIMLPFMILATVVTPLFSQFYSQNQLPGLQRLYTRISRVSFVLVLLGSVFCLFFGEWLMSWYGAEFTQGYGVLLLLCGAKLIHSFFGPVNYLLMMTNTEKEASIAMSFAVVITIVLHIVLIPSYDIWGAAIANLTGSLLFDLLLARIALRKVGLRVGLRG